MERNGIVTSKLKMGKAKQGTLVSTKSLWKRMVEFKEVYLLLLPVALYYIIFKYAPMFGNVIAFQDYSITRGILQSDFVGFKHFISFLNDVYFWRLLKNTLMINLYGLLFAFPAPIILALLLNEIRCTAFKRSVQTITYMPHFISAVVVCGMVLDFVSPSGLVNSILNTLGIESKKFITDPQYFYGLYTVMDIWQGIGWGSIIYISALSGIDAELYEASAIDGASRWQQTLKITLPCLLPTIAICLIMRVGQMLSTGFEKIILLYNPAIYSTSDVISTYVYRKGILGAEYGFSAAVGLFNSIINFLLLVFANWFSKKATGSGMF